MTKEMQEEPIEIRGELITMKYIVTCSALHKNQYEMSNKKNGLVCGKKTNQGSWT